MSTKASPKPDPDTCNTCRYYAEYQDIDPGDPEDEDDDPEEPHDPADYTGVCRRYPPVVFPGLNPISVYPDVSKETGWCGEYTPKS